MSFECIKITYLHPNPIEEHSSDIVGKNNLTFS